MQARTDERVSETCSAGWAIRVRSHLAVPPKSLHPSLKQVASHALPRDWQPRRRRQGKFPAQKRCGELGDVLQVEGKSGLRLASCNARVRAIHSQRSCASGVGCCIPGSVGRGCPVGRLQRTICHTRGRQRPLCSVLRCPGPSSARCWARPSRVGPAPSQLRLPAKTF